MGSHRAWILASVCAIAACQPLYGGKPQGMKNPESRARPPDAGPKPQEIKLVDDCDAQFHDKPTKRKVDATALASHLSAGDTAVTRANKEPAPAPRAGLLLAAIDRYKQALVEDPYSADATYGLAVAYAKFHYSGCALKLINRLADLRSYAPSQEAATRLLSSAYNEDAFKLFKNRLP